MTIIQIQKSTLYGNVFSIRDVKIYEAKKNGEPIYIKTVEGEVSDPIDPRWILNHCQSFKQEGKYIGNPMTMYKVPFTITSKEQKEEKNKKLIMEAMM